MKVVSVFLVAVSLFFINGFRSHAQEAWTLQQCIDYALSHNISVKQSELNEDFSKESFQQSKAGFLPNLNGNASQNYFYGRSIDPTTNLYTNNEVRSNNFSLSSSVPVFEGFQLQNALKQSKLNYLSSQYDLEKIKNDISLTVVTYYLQILYNRELLQSTTERVNATRIQRDKAQRMYELGAVAKGSLLEFEAQFSGDEVQLVNAQSLLDQSILSLTQLLELDSVKDFTIVEPVVEIAAMSIPVEDANSIYSIALKTQPDIKSFEYKVMSAEKGLSVARAGRYPRLSVGGSISTNYSSASQTFTTSPSGNYPIIGFAFDTIPVYSASSGFNVEAKEKSFKSQFDDNISKFVGFSLSVPIFNGWSAKTNINHAKINLQRSQLNLQSTKKSLYKSIQQAVSDAKSANKRYQANDKSVQSLNESFSYNEQKFNTGMISLYDYLLSKNNLAKAKADLLQAKYDFIFRIKVLDFYLGKPLAF